MRIVLDTNVLISATLWKGSFANKLVKSLLLQNSTMIVSNGILLEFDNVLKKKFNLSNQQRQYFLDRVKSFTIIREPRHIVPLVPDDSDDDKIIACALASKANYLISCDKHLLKLKCGWDSKIITPEQLLQEMKTLK